MSLLSHCKKVILVGLLFMGTYVLSQSIILPIKKDFKWGLINENAEIIVAPQYDRINDFDSTGHAIVRVGKSIGLIDTNGILVVPTKFQFERIKSLPEKHFAVQVDGKWGVIDSSFKFTLDPQFEFISLLKENWVIVKQQGKSGLCSLNGDAIVPIKYDELGSFNDSLIKVTEGNSFGLYSGKAEELVDAQYQEIQIFASNRKDFLVRTNSCWSYYEGKDFGACWDSIYVNGDILFVQQQKKWGIFSSKKNDYIIKPSLNSIPENSLSGYVFSKDGMKGLMSFDHEVIIEPIYDNLIQLDAGLLAVQKNGLTGLIRSDGEFILQPLYTGVNFLLEDGDSTSNLIQFKNKGGIGVINEITGAELLPNKYDYVSYDKGKIRGVLDGGADVYVIKNGVVYDQFHFKNFDVLKIDDTKPKGDVWDNYQERRLTNLTRPARTNWTNKVVDSLKVYYDDEIKSWGLGRVFNKDSITPITEPFFHYMWIEDYNNYDFARAKIMIRGRSPRYCLVYKNGRMVFNHPVKEGNKPAKPIAFSFIGNFSEGRAAVNLGGIELGASNDNQQLQNVKKGIWGFIDTTGRFVIEPTFTNVITNFEKGRAIVSSSEGAGVINQNGAVVVPLKFTHVDTIKGTNSWLYKTTITKPLYGFVNTEGEAITDIEFTKVKNFYNGVAPVKSGKYYAFVDTTGRFFADYNIQRTSGFRSGLAAVRLNNLWGYINFRGDTVIKPQFENAGYFDSGLAPIKQDKMYGYIDTTGKLVIPFKYEKAFEFHGGFAIADYNLIDKDGHTLNRAIEYLEDFNSHGLAKVKSKKGYGYIDKMGNVVIDPKYDFLGDFSDSKVRFRKGRKYGFMNTEGEIVIEDKFYEANDFSEGYVSVRGNDRWYFIDSLGNTFINVGARRLGSFTEGKAFAKFSSDSVGFITIYGDFIEVKEAKSIGPFRNGIAVVQTNNDYYYINTEGEPMFGERYSYASDFKDGVAIVINDEGKWGLIDQTGFEIIPQHYLHIGRFQENHSILQLNEIHGVYDGSGKELVPPDYESIDGITEDVLKVYRGGRVGYLRREGTWLWSPAK